MDYRPDLHMPTPREIAEARTQEARLRIAEEAQEYLDYYYPNRPLLSKYAEEETFVDAARKWMRQTLDMIKFRLANF